MNVEPVELLSNMLEIESVSGAERALAEFLEAVMTKAGFEARIDDAGNVVGERSGGRGPVTREIVLLGHMDTVPGRIAVRRVGDLLYGRGAVDAKSPLAAFVVAASRVRLPPDARVVVVGAVEEETTSRGARWLVDRYRPTACIVGEPSGWDAVTLGYKGRLLADYSFARSVAHTAGPEGGVAEAAIAWWHAVTARVEELNEGRVGAFARVQHALRSIRSTSDGLTDTVDATVGFRLPPGVDTAELERAVAAAAGSASVAFRGREAAFVASSRTPLASPFLAAIRSVGGSPRFKHKTGTSDMNVVGPAWGCPIVAYGPGDSALDHTPDEHVSVAEYLRSIAVLENAVETFLLRGRADAASTDVYTASGHS